MVMLQRLSVSWRENGHVTEVVSLKKGEWSCYGGCHLNGGRKVIRGSSVFSFMEGEWSCYSGGQFKGGRMVMLRRLSL